MKKLTITPSITKRDTISIKDHFQDISKYKELTAEEEVSCFQRYHKGDIKAFTTIVNANLRFVVSVAKQYQNLGVDIEDLISVGNIGLMKAIETFDETRGFKLISYAVWTIRQEIQQAIANEANIIKRPISHTNKLLKIKHGITMFVQQHQRQPSHEELSEMLNIPIAEIRNCLQHNPSTTSLDAPITYDDEEYTLRDQIADNSESPFNNLTQESLRYDIYNLLNTLAENEREIIQMYFGIGYPHSISLEEIALNRHLTKERVRQMMIKGLKKLRRTPKTQKIRELYAV